MNIPLGKIAGSPLSLGGGSFPRRSRGSVVRGNPNQDGNQAPLGRKALINETQRILLQFSIKEAAELQDATERAVESQRNGESSISLQAAANMCRGSAKARALFAPLLGFSGVYTDPDFMEHVEMAFGGYLQRQVEQFGASDESEADDEAVDLFEGRA